MATKKKRDRIALLCDDCGVEIFVDENMIMVKDELWAKIIKMGGRELKHEDSLCDTCMENRLGRPLTRDDWEPASGEGYPYRYPLCNLMTEASKKNK